MVCQDKGPVVIVAFVYGVAWREFVIFGFLMAYRVGDEKRVFIGNVGVVGKVEIVNRLFLAEILGFIVRGA